MPAIYLTVPFREKDEAKSLGARWDAARKRWYVPDGVDAAPFARWQTDDGGGASMPIGIHSRRMPQRCGRSSKQPPQRA